jgi:hypothetical protein
MIDDFEFSPDQPIAIQLPLEIAEAIAQRMQQTGETQAQVILAALQFALHPSERASHPALEEIKHRLAELESLIPKVAVLEGKLIAF